MALPPLIAICGTTGVGKSRLAVELALAVSGKVINADAMQVYQGLDTLTNKLPADEQRGVEHVLMDFKRPGEQYVVGEWIRDARREIAKAHAEGRVPIVVGGTTYWIHHLLFPSGLPAQTGPSKCLSAHPNGEIASALRSLPENLAILYRTLPASAPSAKSDPDKAFALYTLLYHLDPLMAGRWHWKDTRKVLRNLEIIKEHGRMASDVLMDAYTELSDHRYRTLIFWLYASPDVLNARLEERVDHMLSHGLLDEIRSMRDIAMRISDALDFTSGIFQAIGFKEFSVYLSRDGKDERAYDLAAAEMKQNTIKYARRQIKWIRNKMLPALEMYRSKDAKVSDKAYLLDATDLSTWEEHVCVNAKKIASAFLLASETPEPFSLSEAARKMLSVASCPTKPADVLLARRKIVCTTCTTIASRPVMLEEGREWEAHQRTAIHKRMQKDADNKL